MSAGIRAGSSNDGYVQVNGNDIITALSNGNVGIGTSSPSTKLHVDGTITATSFSGGIPITSGSSWRVVTSSNASTLKGEQNLQFDGTDLYISDGIKHKDDTDTEIGFPAADQIQFDTGGTNYLKLHRYSSVNFVEVGSGAHISLANNGANGRSILIGDANASSTGSLHLQAGGGSTGFGGGIRLYSHANSTNAGGVYIGKSLNSSGSIILGNGGTSPSHEYLKINSSGKSSFKSQNANTVCISLLDNDSSNEIWRVGQAADGDGYMQCLTDEGAANVLLDASGNSYVAGGNFGIGLTSPAKKLQVKEASSSSGVHYLAHVGGSSHLANYAVGLGLDPEGYTARTKIAIVAEGTGAGYSRGKLHFLLDDANDSGEATLSESRMTILDSGKIGINQTSPDGLLHIFSASAGSVTADADADELTLENSGNVGLSLLTAGDKESSIYFGNPGTNGQKDGWIKYYHESHQTVANRRALTFKTGGGSEKMRLDKDGRLRIGGTNEAADGAFDDLIIGKHAAGTNVGISILCTNGQQGALGFAKSGTLADGYVAYVHNSTATSSVMTIKSSGTIQFNTSSASNPQIQLNNDGNFYLRNSNELNLNNANNTASCKLYCDGGARLRISSYNHDMLRMENASSIIFLNNSAADTPYSINNVGRSVWTNKTRMDRECYTKNGEIGEGGTTADATGINNHNPGAYVFNGNTPVRGSDTSYKFWMQSGDNYPHASNFIEINIKNSGMYRVTIKGSHSSATADMAMYLIYGLANSSGNLPPVVVRIDRSSTTSENSNTSGSFSTSVQGYGSSGSNATYDSTLRITYSGNNNQGLLAFIEEWY